MKLKSQTKGLLAAAALALTIIAAPASVAKAEGTQGTYIVEKNDCLSKIAKKVYGNEKLWRIIYDANSSVVKSNYIIYKNQVLIIPAVGSSGGQQVTENTPATQTPAPAENVQAPQATSQTTPASGQEETYTLDYNAIASWVDNGFIGNDASGAPVVLALDSTGDYAVIIFGDNSDMTAASFAGAVTYAGDYATITDEANGMALTFSVAEVGDGTIALDMGDIGSAVVTAATRENVLATIKIAIENYTHIA